MPKDTTIQRAEETLNGVIGAATNEQSKQSWHPDNAKSLAESYGQGVMVGVIATYMSLRHVELSQALNELSFLPEFYNLNINCIPLDWHGFLVIDNGLVVGVK